MAKKIRAAIIGLGNIGFGYSRDLLRRGVSSHLQAYREHANFVPAAVCDIDKTRLKAAKDYMPSLNAYISWEAMLKKEKIDILSICVSPLLNLDVCESSFLKGVKGLILEKPLADNLSAARRIIKAIKSKKLVAAVNYFRRWQEIFGKAKEIIDAGTIGKILKVNAFYPKGIWSGGSHMIDILQYLLGDFASVRALSKKRIKQSDDPLYSVLGYIGKAEIFLSGFNKRDFNLFEIEMWGNKGKIAISDFGNKISLWQSLESKRFSKQKELFIVKEILVEKGNSYFFSLLDNIVNALENKAKKVLCTPEDALKTIAVICSIEKSYTYEKEISLTRR